MPNKNYFQDNYYTRPQCAQQSAAVTPQYVPFPMLSNGGGTYNYDLLYPTPTSSSSSSKTSQYVLPAAQTTTSTGVVVYEQQEAAASLWLQQQQQQQDKIETIEISSRDLSPAASCCSNLDLLIPDFYKSASNPSSYLYYNYSSNKNHIDYPSCSQINEQNNVDRTTVKYCSIQKPPQQQHDLSPPFPDCAFYNAEFLNADGILDAVPSLEQQQQQQRCSSIINEDSNNDSDIIVEESDEELDQFDATNRVEQQQERKFNCMICNVIYSPIGNQFYYLSAENPLTMSSQKSVHGKLQKIVGNFSNDANNSYICSQCLSLINTIDHLEMKLAACRNELIEKYQKTNNLLIDALKYINGDEFTCNLCGKCYSYEKLCQLHVHRHATFIKRHLCEFCGRRFTKLRNFIAHKKRLHHDDNAAKMVRMQRINAFACRQCGKAFRTRTNLRDHVNFCTGKLPHKCRHCSKKFATSTKLKNHVKLKHDKKFTSICSICNIGFIKASDHKMHMVSHTTDKKFQCDRCDKAYKTLSNLRFHAKFHAAQLPHICAICAKGFMRKEYLESHLSAHTGEKHYTCTVCDKKFVSQKNLDAHFKQHEAGGAKKKSCNVCGKLIAKGLEDHMRTHTNLKEFECDRCEMRFNTKGALFKHRKRKHVENVT